MKKFIIIIAWLCVTSIPFQPVQAQSHELQQLILNLEKLQQLRSILDQMYTGYQALVKGYNTVKDLSEGNFSLHKVFLDKLLQVSPLVKKYKRVVDIVTIQRSIVREFKTALVQLRKPYNDAEVDYFNRVYNNLVDRSLKNLDELLMVITAKQLRMNDAERLSAIDRIHADMQDKLVFLRAFTGNAKLLSLQKEQQFRELKKLEKLHGTDQ
jgi:hypothetical protein